MKPPRMNPGELARRAQQATESLAAYQVSKKAEGAARKANPVLKKRTPRPEHGQRIFVYNHLQKNHVVYSLTKAMNNNAALTQLPYNGKKSVPAALRKDLWHPLAQITFPEGSGAIGLSAFQKLREYRKRHELEWGDEIWWDENGGEEKKGAPRKIKDRNRMICDQKANSVADIAAVLSRLAAPEKPVVVLKEGDEGYVAPEEGTVVKAEGGEEKVKPPPTPKKLPNIGLIGEGSGTQVQVLWSHLQDAEFAETWGENVEHGVLPVPTAEIPPWLVEKQRRAREREELEESRLVEMEMTEEAREELVKARLEKSGEQFDALSTEDHEALKQAREAFFEERNRRELAARKREEEQRTKWDAMSPSEKEALKQQHRAERDERNRAFKELPEEEKEAIRQQQQAHKAEKKALAEEKTRELQAILAKEKLAEKEEKRRQYEAVKAEAKAKWEAMTEQEKLVAREEAKERKLRNIQEQVAQEKAVRGLWNQKPKAEKAEKMVL